MFCKFCGNNMPESSSFCPSCGKQQNETTQVVQQVQMISVQSPKNLGLGLALAFLFGPLGLLYSSVKYACILIALNMFFGLVSCGSMAASMSSPHEAAEVGVFGGVLFWLIVFGSWIASMILSWYAIKKYNDNVRSGKMNRDID